jgi:transposase
LYLFGAFSPIDGDMLFMEADCCDANAFQAFLDELSSKKPDELKILVLDNGAFHKSKSLKIPENIGLIFIPPYSPELNPAEAIWKNMKRKFTNKLCKTLDDLSDFITKTTNEISPKIVMTTCGYPYISQHLNWTI